MKTKSIKSSTVARVKKINPITKNLDESFLDEIGYKDGYTTFKESYNTRREFLNLKLRRENTVFTKIFNFIKPLILKAYNNNLDEIKLDYSSIIPSGEGDSRLDYYLLSFILPRNIYSIPYESKVLKLEKNKRGEDKIRLKGFSVRFINK